MPFQHAIKTAIAAVLTILLYQLFNIPEGIWAAISAVIVMQANLGGSLSASRSRFLGTAIGASMGIACMSILGQSPWSVGIALVLAILLCSYFKLKESYRLASATVLLVMLVHGPNVWILGLYRFLNVILGIIVALIVSIFIWPSRAREHLRHGLSQVLMDCGQLYQLLVDSYLRVDHQQTTIDNIRIQIKQTFHRNHDLLKESLEELAKTPSEDQALTALMTDEERIIDHILSIDEATQNTQGDSFYLKLAPKLTELAQRTTTAFSQVAEAITTRQSQLQIPDLNSALTAVDEQLLALRKEAVSYNHSLDEIVRFYSFVYNMKELAKDIQNMATTTSDLH
jgi:uncharacterized membrane protein YccC